VGAIDPKAEAILEERFGKDTLLSLATMDGGRPAVRIVDAVYEKGSFYSITYALSGKMRQIEANPEVAVCGEWFTGHGVGGNLGPLSAEGNKALHQKLKTAFAAWYDNGHINESDPNTVILRIRLTDGVLMSHGTRYELNFSE
jgi:general stress protein 26